MNIDIQNHSAEVSAEINAARAGKDRAGGRGYAKKLCPVDTGNLRNSIRELQREYDFLFSDVTDDER
mgnify:CR=1 FL=1|nr:hypothetical protein [uncultured Dysosmobacter sp.]